MSSRVKIAVAAINLACLITTLAYPDNVTPFVLLMTLVSVVSWAFTSSVSNKIGLYLYIMVAAIMAVVCIVLGVTSTTCALDSSGQEIIAVSQIVDEYIIRFNPRVFLVGGEQMSYAPFAFCMFLGVFSLMVLEIVYSELNADRKSNYSHSIASYINRQIKRIN